jgi:hypothetical protein
MRRHAALILSILLATSAAQAQDADPCASVRGSSPEAEACAQRDYAAARASQQRLEPFVAPPPGFSPQPSLDSFEERIHQWGALTAANAAQFDRLLRYRIPRWALLAYVAQASRYEALAAEVVAAADELARGRRLPPGALADRFATDIAPVQCLAVVRYVLVVRAARAGAMFADPSARFALERLHVYGSQAIADCARDETHRDPTFRMWTPDELIALPPLAGMLAPLDVHGPPPLAPAE